jgi:hypothetical protein
MMSALAPGWSSLPSSAKERGYRADRAHADAKLCREIRNVASDFLPHEQPFIQMATTFAALEQQLLDAGFCRHGHAQYKAGLEPDGWTYHVRAWSRWTHPDCDTPFYIRLGAEASIMKAWRGLVVLMLKMGNTPSAKPGTGILAEREYKESVMLALRKDVVSAQAWADHVREAFLEVNQTRLKATFERALQYVESTTTP